MNDSDRELLADMFLAVAAAIAASAQDHQRHVVHARLDDLREMAHRFKYEIYDE